MIGSPRKTFAFVFALVMLAATDAAAQRGVISGVVTTRAGGEPVAGAAVTVRQSTGGTAGNATTDDQGRYRIAVPPGTYSVVVRRIGFISQTVEAVMVDGDAMVETNVALAETARLLTQVDVTSGPTTRATAVALGTIGNVKPFALETRVPITPLDLIPGEVGFDFPKAGLQAGNPVFRGFNNIFSGSLLMISDYRFAGVPSLRVNTPYLIPTTNEDVANVQFLLGPASALYGPNATSGVVHIISKSPFDWEGTTLSVGGGERSAFRAGIRHAAAPSTRFGYKISGMLFRARDWEYNDPAETLPRDFDITRWSGEIRADYAPSDSSMLILQAGRAEAGSALEMTGIGTAQANDWSNTYYQARFTWHDLFLQTFLNQSHTDNTRLLRTQQLIIDKSRVIAAQARHAFDVGSRQNFAYGADFQFTDPRTEGTINGRNEDDDKITEYGAFVQSETHLSPRLDFVVSVRGDKNSRLDDPVFSPRAALIFKPASEQTLRLTFNSAFATPTPNNLFLDVLAQRLSPQLPYFIRTLGVPPGGFQFRRDCAGGKGGLCMRSPFAAPPGAPTVPFMPTDVTLLWPVVKQLLAARGIDTTGFGTPTSAQIPTRLRIVTAPGDTITPSQLRDVEPLKANLVRTYEVGYSGTVAGRIQLTADAYYETRRNFTGPLVIETPNAFFDAPGLVGYLVSRGRSLAEAQAIATVIAPIPFGTVTPDNPLTQNADLMLTYRNYGKLKRWGADLGFEAPLTLAAAEGSPRTNEWTVYGSYSWVNKDLFPREEVGGVSDVTLNAPKKKAALGVRFGQEPTGLSVDLRGRWADRFPMNSGVFVGTVESYTVVDATLAYKLPFAKSTTFSVDATNILNKKHRELVGAPEIGRFVMTQLQVTF
jgi:outer membrane receptor for ferrienterochelin and colicins